MPNLNESRKPWIVTINNKPWKSYETEAIARKVARSVSSKHNVTTEVKYIDDVPNWNGRQHKRMYEAPANKLPSENLPSQNLPSQHTATQSAIGGAATNSGMSAQQPDQQNDDNGIEQPIGNDDQQMTDQQQDIDVSDIFDANKLDSLQADELNQLKQLIGKMLQQ